MKKDKRTNERVKEKKSKSKKKKKKERKREREREREKEEGRKIYSQDVLDRGESVHL